MSGELQSVQSLLKHDTRTWRRFRLAVLAFGFGLLLFSFGSSQVAYLLDVCGISGIRPQTDAAIATRPPDETGLNARKIVPLPGAEWQILPAPRPLTIDGNADDWNLCRGQFFTDNYVEHRGTRSVWLHLMYDAQTLYVLARVRDLPTGNSGDIETGPGDGEFLQLLVDTNRRQVLNIWRKDGVWMVQRRIYHDRKITNADARRDGVRVAGWEHDDEAGYNVELSIPWTAVIEQPFRGKDLPQVGQGVRLDFGARLEPQLRIGRITRDKFPEGRFHHSWLWPVNITRPLPLMVGDDKGEADFVFLTRMVNDELRVNWDAPMSLYRTCNAELPVGPADGIVIDGKSDEWTLTAGVVGGDDVSAPRGIAFSLHAAADAENLYLLALLSDPTPARAQDGIMLSLVTDKMHRLELGANRLLLDGAVPAGAAAAADLRRDGNGYRVEAGIPWSALGGRPATGFPVTCKVKLSPRWQFTDLMSVLPDRFNPDDPEQWARAVFIKEYPPDPQPVPLVSRECVPVLYDDGWLQMPERKPRSRYETEHRHIDVLPGTATIDGDSEDWDLSGGIFMCWDTSALRDVASAWFHVMYDDRGMYFLFRHNDLTPNVHEPDVHSHRDDMCQIRLRTDWLIHFTLCRMPDGDLHEVDYGPLRPRRGERIPDGEHGLRMAFRVNSEKDGYVHEIFAPWSTICKDREPYRAGETCGFTAEFRHDLDRKTADIFGHGGKWHGSYGLDQGWGEARFRSEGAIRPQPCRLRGGQLLPVRLVDGKPQVDWSALQQKW